MELFFPSPHPTLLLFGTNAAPHLYSTFGSRPLNESGAATFHAEAYIPTQPAQAIEEARISLAHEDPGRPEGSFPPPRQGAQAGLCKARIPRIIVGNDPAQDATPAFRESYKRLESLRPSVCRENRINVSSHARERCGRARVGSCVMPISSVCTSRDAGIFQGT